MKHTRSDAADIDVRHVVLPLDGSDFALAALPTARALADRFGARLSTISIAADDAEGDRLRQQATDALGDGATVHVVVGSDPVEEVRRRADDLGGCVICLSTRGRGRVSGALIGSVARGLLQSSDDPVVVVGPQADRPPSLVRSGDRYRRPSGFPEPLSVPRLLACVDGSPVSEEIGPVVAGWAAALQMSVAVVTVSAEVAAPLVAGGARAAGGFGPEDPERYVGGLAAAWATAGVEVTGEVIRDPIGVASGLRQHLGRHPAGLVALATHVRTGMERVRLGATAADIVRTSNAPVLVVPVRTESS